MAARWLWNLHPYCWERKQSLWWGDISCELCTSLRIERAFSLGMMESSCQVEQAFESNGAQLCSQRRMHCRGPQWSKARSVHLIYHSEGKPGRTTEILFTHNSPWDFPSIWNDGHALMASFYRQYHNLHCGFFCWITEGNCPDIIEYSLWWVHTQCIEHRDGLGRVSVSG